MFTVEAFDEAGNAVTLSLAEFVQELISQEALPDPEQAETTEVDVTKSATFGFEAYDIHNNGTKVEFNDGNLDGEFTREENIISVAGQFKEIEGVISLNAPDGGASNYWSRPKMRVIRDGQIIAVFDDLVMQQNGAYDGDVTMVGAFIDKEPPENPTYTFEWFDKDARTATLLPETFSQLALRARKTVEVLIP